MLLDCDREISQRLQLAAGEVEALSLPRARTRWPGYRSYIEAANAWLTGLNLGDLLPECAIALMACRGARYHHDAEQYGDMLFCNLFLSADKGLDLHFPFIERRIALQPGTMVIFDTAQTHGVIDRANNAFKEDDFPPERDCNLLFLTWELPLTDHRVAKLIG